MKMRNGFVSNSSSSSFLIAIHKPYDCCPECGKQNVEFLDLIAKHDYDATDTEINGIGAEHILYKLGRAIREGWESNNYYRNKIEEVSQYKGDRDWLVADISISYHDEKLNELFNTLVKEGKIKLIGKDG